MCKFLLDIDTWQEILDSLRKNKLRSTLTMVGVWWGILLLIGLLGSARGVENSFNRLFGDFATNSIYIRGGVTSIPFKGFQDGKRVRLTLNDAKKIEDNIEGVELVVPRNGNQRQVIRDFSSSNFSVSGDYPILDLVEKKNLKYGRFINQNDINKKRKVAVISERVFTQLFNENENVVGENIKINNINFKIIGLFKNKNIGLGSAIHIPFSTFQQVYNQGNKIRSMMITVNPEYNIIQVEKDVKLLLKNLNNIHPEDNRALEGFNLGKKFKEFTVFLKAMQFFTWFVGIATIIAGVFAIGNILIITVKERTKEIGVRRAVGATPFEIKRQIVTEAVSLTLIAGLFGIISGGWILIAIDHFFGQGDDAVIVNASVSIPIVFIALLILVTLGSLIGLIPAFKATNVKPIEALKEE